MQIWRRNDGIMCATALDTKYTVSEQHFKKIQQIADSIRYGTITLVIQDGRLIQIDRSEKIRIAQDKKRKTGLAFISQE